MQVNIYMKIILNGSHQPLKLKKKNIKLYYGPSHDIHSTIDSLLPNLYKMFINKSAAILKDRRLPAISTTIIHVSRFVHKNYLLLRFQNSNK